MSSVNLYKATEKVEVIDNLTSTDIDKAGSANQLKILDEKKFDKQHPIQTVQQKVIVGLDGVTVLADDIPDDEVANVKLVQDDTVSMFLNFTEANKGDGNIDMPDADTVYFKRHASSTGVLNTDIGVTIPATDFEWHQALQTSDDTWEYGGKPFAAEEQKSLRVIRSATNYPVVPVAHNKYILNTENKPVFKLKMPIPRTSKDVAFKLLIVGLYSNIIEFDIHSYLYAGSDNWYNPAISKISAVDNVGNIRARFIIGDDNESYLLIDGINVGGASIRRYKYITVLVKDVVVGLGGSLLTDTQLLDGWDSDMILEADIPALSTTVANPSQTRTILANVPLVTNSYRTTRNLWFSNTWRPRPIGVINMDGLLEADANKQYYATRDILLDLSATFESSEGSGLTVGMDWGHGVGGNWGHATDLNPANANTSSAGQYRQTDFKRLFLKSGEGFRLRNYLADGGNNTYSGNRKVRIDIREVI